MKPRLALLLPIILTLTLVPAGAMVRYVNLANPSPVSPYTTWNSAATNIQDAIDAANGGDEIVVTNGVYSTGGRTVEGLLTNRVAVTKPVIVRSVNGPEVTVIRGYQVPGTTNGNGAVRCVYFANGAALMGFTLTNGAARNSGGYSDLIGGGALCESPSAMLSNCIITRNSAYLGGGGAGPAFLPGPDIPNNGGNLRNCVLVGNSARAGGGAFRCSLNGCVLTGNSADEGGAAYAGVLNNCTLTGNLAGYTGGGTAGGFGNVCALNNCILYHNFALREGANYGSWTILNYSCTTPMPRGGIGNIEDEPQLASDSHLIAGSPCRGAGGVQYSTGVDVDGEAWANPPSIGCDELHAGNLTGPLSVAILAGYTNFATGLQVSFSAQINGRTSSSRWDFGDGTLLSNRPYATHAWTLPGDYPVILWAYNESYPGGVSATVTMRVLEPPVHYVAAGSGDPVAPYSSWTTAATSIQDAVDAASLAGALVLVSNGVYQTGGRVADGSLTNRVAVTKPVRVQSLNGPEVTIIRGYQLPGTTNGFGAVRCVYLANGAALVGFTLTNGGTWTEAQSHDQLELLGLTGGGGVRCESTRAMVSNCVFNGNSAFYGGGAYDGTLNSCMFRGNSAVGGGGTSGGTLNNCTFIGNGAEGGAGAYSGTLNNCRFTGNSAINGGGAAEATLNNCTLSGNSAQYGGGTQHGTLNNCILASNSAKYEGGGAYEGTLNNCTLMGNSAIVGAGARSGVLNNCSLTGNFARDSGGGAWGGTLNNCTIISNTAAQAGGAGGLLNNCIVYHNAASVAGANYLDATFNYSCTTPLPPNGVGNISDEPQLKDSSHLSETSPCRGRGHPAYVTAVDIDDQPWAFPPSMGCDEFRPITGSIIPSIHASCTAVPSGYSVDFTPQIQGLTTAIRWDLGDGTIVSNQLAVTHSWATSGEHAVRLTTFNDTHPEGVTATLTVLVSVNPVLYVSLDSTTPSAPYTSWNMAARTIQDAVDALCQSGTIIVSNGVYGSGGRAVSGEETNRVAVIQPITIRSLNGPGVTIIDGGGAARCVYLENSGAVLSGFTLSNGIAQAGGGVLCPDANTTISNCVIIANRASFFGGGSSGGTLENCHLIDNAAGFSGGGASSSTLHNCTLEGNSAGASGGGVFRGTLSNCTLIGNSANQTGGGAAGEDRIFFRSVCRLNNCIVYYNVAGQGGDNYDSLSELNASCTTPLPPSGQGNFENRPRLVDLVGGDFQLQLDSPCINAGLNAYATGGIDLAGNSRIAGGTVDVGAYELQSPQSTISYAWLQHYGLPADGSADNLDPDADQMSTCQEWRAGTDPTDSSSVLRVVSLERIESGWRLTWQSVVGRTYRVERDNDDLSLPSNFAPVATNLPGEVGATSFIDTIYPDAGPYFYRVRVEE